MSDDYPIDAVRDAFTRGELEMRKKLEPLVSAARAYRFEYLNPTPDYVQRRAIRNRLFEAISLLAPSNTEAW